MRSMRSFAAKKWLVAAGGSWGRVNVQGPKPKVQCPENNLNQRVGWCRNGRVRWRLSERCRKTKISGYGDRPVCNDCQKLISTIHGPTPLRMPNSSATTWRICRHQIEASPIYPLQRLGIMAAKDRKDRKENGEINPQLCVLCVLLRQKNGRRRRVEDKVQGPENNQNRRLGLRRNGRVGWRLSARGIKKLKCVVMWGAVCL